MRISILGAVLALSSVVTSFPTSFHDQRVLGESDHLRLISVGEDHAEWLPESAKLELRRSGVKFMDITGYEDLGALNAERFVATAVKFPKKPEYQDEVGPVLKNLTTKNMKANLEIFTHFHNRYYKSENGAASGKWLYEMVNKTASANPHIEVSQFHHPWGQHSVIAHIPGKKSNKTVVIGAHQDSANLFLPSILSAPGADDDGSGTVTTLEAFRALIAQGFKPDNNVEFHWYSAEEGGLLGSQAVFAEYEKQHRDVIAMLQQDMTGYNAKTIANGGPDAVGVITDFVHPGLTDFIKTIITEYCDIGFTETKCGYACSDHASASKAGYPSAFVIESTFDDSNKNIHTTEDTIDKLSFEHMFQHAKLTAAFAVELSHL
ncbi:Leucine aminopeptidase 1 [Saitoella coloradoensis]